MSENKRSILLVDSDPQRQASLSAALAGYRVVSASDREAAVAELASLKPDLILAAPQEARKLVKDLERAAPDAVRAFICDRSDAKAFNELSDIAAEGHRFFTVEGSSGLDRLRTSVQDLVTPRLSHRHLVDLALETTFDAGETTFRGVCVDLSNRGLAIQLTADAPVERVLPGSTIAELRVRRGARVVLAAGSAQVRHVRRSGEGYLVGLALGSIDEDVVSNPVEVHAMLRRAHRRGASLTVFRPGEGNGLPAAAWILEPGGELRLEGALFARAGDVLDLAFDLGGKSYRATTGVLRLDGGATLLASPRSLAARHRRGRVRFACPPAHSFAVSYQSPVTGAEHRHEVLDLQLTGLSFQFDGREEVLPQGLAFPALHLHLPDGRQVTARARVVSVATDGALGQARCGLELLEVPPAARQAIVDAFLVARCPNLRDGRDLSFGDIWALMLRANNRYIDYPEGDAAAFAELEATHQLMAQSGEGLAKAFVFHDEGRPVGAGYGLRVYSRTWLSQHLAVEPGFHRGEQISRDLTTSAIDYAELLPDIEFFRCMWKTTNRWSERVMGWTYRTLKADGLSFLRYVNYLRLEAGQPLQVSDSRLPVRTASPADLFVLERHFREKGELIRLRADDLGVDQLRLEELGDRFGAAGMHRSREIFAVDGANGPVLFGLVEHATRGLVWPEFQNGLQVVVVDPNAPELDAAWAAMLAHCERHYRSRGQQVVIAMAEDAELPHFQAAGFTQTWRLAEWTFHRSAVRTTFNIVTSFFERFAARRNKGD